MSRHKARTDAMKILYKYSITGDLSIPEADESLFSIGYFDEKDLEYLNGIVTNYRNNSSCVDELIRENLKGWTFERISKVDLAILRLALVEIRYLNTPPKVAVNEAVEMAKEYSGDKAFKFVNGLLGTVVKNVSPICN